MSPDFDPSFFKSSSGAISAHTGAEGSQNSYLISTDIRDPLTEFSRAARGPGFLWERA